MDEAVVEWWQEADGGCSRMAQPLPDGAPRILATLEGGCEIASIAPRGEILLVLRGQDQIDRVTPDGSEPLGTPDGWPRQVGWTPDGAPLALTADLAGGVFQVRTFAWTDGEWALREETTEDRATVRAVEGGPVWKARSPGGTAETWTLESAPGFALLAPNDLKIPRRLRVDGTLLWGTVPVPGGLIAVRYTMLGVPLPAGPVLWRDGKRWSSLDDSRFLETPASVGVRGSWLLVTYEGWSPILVDLATGASPWKEEEEPIGRAGAR